MPGLLVGLILCLIPAWPYDYGQPIHTQLKVSGPHTVSVNSLFTVLNIPRSTMSLVSINSPQLDSPKFEVA